MRRCDGLTEDYHKNQGEGDEIRTLEDKLNADI